MSGEEDEQPAKRSAKAKMLAMWSSSGISGAGHVQRSMMATAMKIMSTWW